VIQAVDEEERTLLQGQRVGPGAIEVRQMAVMRFDDVAEGDRLEHLEYCICASFPARAG